MKNIIFITLLLIHGVVSAQHDHTKHSDPKPKQQKEKNASEHPMKSDTMKDHMHDMQHGEKDEHAEHAMSNSYSRHLPMHRNGSGTGWSPDASPMYGVMVEKPLWSHMFHYNIFARYNNQDFTSKGSRGDEDFDIPTWFMFMGQRPVGETGLFHYSTMISFDPFLVCENGYPLLFQSGESYNGEPLVDRQHPHDLFSELAASYAHSFSEKSDLFLYLGYPGEPALGPVAFMHRASALDNPNSPLSHHWVDATHITFGVATLGLRTGLFKFESSIFTGREPDEDRYDLDKPRFDSWSGRISLNPNEKWAFQVSHGFLKSPESFHPDENINRTTASATYASANSGPSALQGTFVWGMNSIKDEDSQHAFMVEGAARFDKAVVYGRYDFVQKSAEELNLAGEPFEGNPTFNINAFTFGLNYDLFRQKGISIAPGTQVTLNITDKDLKPIYGDWPLGFQIYLRVYPTKS
jgi:hypothetical protein